MPTPAIVFDFGNVIAYFDFEKATAKLSGRLGLTGRELLDRLRPVGLGPLLQEFESGRIAAVEFSARLSALVSLSITHDEFAAAWGEIFTANESIIPVVESLKRQGYRLVLGSNTNDIHAARFREQFATTLAHFDRLVLSYEVGHLKPHRDFYLACAEAAGFEPGECVFIDDLPENVAGATAAGLIGIVYHSTAELIGDLAALGIKIESF